MGYNKTVSSGIMNSTVDVNIKQRLLRNDDAFMIKATTISSGAPYTDAFHIEQDWDFSPIRNGKGTRISLASKIVFKYRPLVAGMIESKFKKGSQEFYSKLIGFVQAQANILKAKKKRGGVQNRSSP